MYFISAPFGNYININNSTSVTGSWTLAPRPGLAKQIATTLRYTRSGWTNRIGLRNKGIAYALKHHRGYNVMSLAAIEKDDWLHLHSVVDEHTSVEINISCPNLGKQVDQLYPGFDLWTQGSRKWCIAKISPTAENKLIDKLVDSGYNVIHASNTLDSAQGALSGKVLIPYTMNIIEYIREVHPQVEVIAGGGVTCPQDAKDYFNAGADHISLGTVCFTPWKLKGIINGQ